MQIELDPIGTIKNTRTAVEDSKIEKSARHSRNNKDWPKIGIFAQRGNNRPNRLGATIVKIIKRDGTRLFVQGLDAVNGTPVLRVLQNKRNNRLIKTWEDFFAQECVKFSSQPFG
jgi:tRNA (Thr-GGU) A37 N-methylase